MDISGQRAAAARPSDHRASGIPGHARRLGGVLAVVAGMGLLAACSQTLRSGPPLPVTALESLRPGVSTAQDVRKALGEPQGHGGLWMAQNPHQDLWVYQNTDVEGMRSHMKVLLVFLDQKTGVYGGYMWFGSGQIFSTSKQEGPR